MSEVTVVELDPQLVLGMGRKGAYREIVVMLPRIFEFAFNKNIPIAGYPVFLCHEITHEEIQKANKDENADIEVAVPISGTPETTNSKGIRGYELPGGKIAKIIHRDPYEECSQTYEKLFARFVEKGKKIIESIREVYFNYPREVRPEEILTEIYAPLG